MLLGTPALPLGLSTFRVDQTGNVTTTSLSDVRMGSVGGVGGLILTPGAGVYAAHFGTSVSVSGNGNSLIATLYVNGIPRPTTVTTFGQNNANQIEALSIHDIITVGVGAAVEIMWRVSANTGTARVGSLLLLKIG